MFLQPTQQAVGSAYADAHGLSTPPHAQSWPVWHVCLPLMLWLWGVLAQMLIWPLGPTILQP